VHDRCRRLGRRGAQCSEKSRCARRPSLHECRRSAARRSRVRADFCNDGRARSADLASSGRHGGNARLSLREEIAIRDVVVFPLAVRDVGRDDAHGFLRSVRSLSEAENHHASSRRNDPLLRRSRRSGPQGTRPAHIGRGLFKNSSVPEPTAHGLPARLLCRHGDVRRWRCCNALWPGILRRFDRL